MQNEVNQQDADILVSDFKVTQAYRGLTCPKIGAARNMQIPRVAARNQEDEPPRRSVYRRITAQRLNGRGRKNAINHPADESR